MVVLKYPLNLQYNGYSEAFIFGHEGSHLWLASICTDLYDDREYVYMMTGSMSSAL